VVCCSTRTSDAPVFSCEVGGQAVLKGGEGAGAGDYGFRVSRGMGF
jgi:hypothetical protein